MDSLRHLEEDREKKRAALLSVGSALLLLSLKTFLVIRTGSLGVLSEALHSGLDLIAAIITFLSVRVADQPADERHPYGHGKFENFSAFVETGLLALTALYIIYEAFARLFFRSVHIQPSITAILVLFLALSIDLTRARALRRVARKYSSEALEADALHFSTDVWSTLVVISGIGLVWVGEAWNLAWLIYADALAALAVAAVILWVGSQLGRRTLDALLDAAPLGLQQEITRAVSRMDGVLDVERVRVRRAGSRHFVDATVSVARTASIEQVHALTDAIEKRIGEIVPSDVMVHAEPRAPQGESLFEAIRAVAQRMGLAIHDVHALQQDGQLFVELHLEVDENLSLRDAHRQASELEDKIRELRGGPIEVNIHIEPLGRHIATPDTGIGEMKQLSAAIEEFVNHLRSEFDELVNCHEVHVRQVEHRLLVSCHCTMKSVLPITQVHDVTAALEDRVKERFQQVSRVTIHPEPVDER
ncbi:MAG TPA: cation diffusion facilitator family transporter [Candidatus Acidoferrum sp.]|nr:cation diffusion facilitator family transporter [Candidatus Acidoferrum sp.]